MYDRSVNTDGYIEFLEELKKKHGNEPFTIYLDSLPVHKTKRARKMCEREEIELILAPIYKPEYNSIEHMHGLLKHIIKK